MYKKTLFILISYFLIIDISHAEFTEKVKIFGDNLTNNLLSSVITFILTSASVVFFYGLVIFILGRTSDKGDLKELEKGRSFMLWGLISLFVMVSAWGIIRVSQNLLDIEGGDINIKPVSFNINVDKEKKEGIQKFGTFAGRAIGKATSSQSTNTNQGGETGILVNQEEDEEEYVEEYYPENDAPLDYVESCNETLNNSGIFNTFLKNTFVSAVAQQYCTMKDLTASNQKILKSFVNLSIPCPVGTKDLGIVQTEYIPLNKPKIRLCQITSIKGVGRNTKDEQVKNPVFNAVVADKFQKLGEALTLANNNKPFVAISSFRTHGTNFYSPKICKDDPDNCSGDGYSLHQLGVAIDFDRKVMNNNTKGDITCKNRAVSSSKEWQLVNRVAPFLGIKQLANESWHWDTFPDPNTRCE